jgi:glycosyltransferase involved in cell wall biosynthesis
MVKISAKHPDTYVVIPVYNEQQTITSVLNEVGKYYSNIICVNDGSKDDSPNIIASHDVILVSHSVNLGAGAATQTGIDYALLDPAARYFVTVDADGQHEIKDADRMLNHLKKNNLDIVFGSRFMGDVQNISGVKRAFLKLAAQFSKKTSGVYLTDPHIGIRAFNRKFAENLKMTLPDFAHASELVERVAEGKYKYDEVPVTVTYSDYSKRKGQPMLNAINIMFDLMLDKLAKK